MPLARKAEIYAICRQYDVVIIEDDPYYYLQFPDASGAPIPLTIPFFAFGPCTGRCGCGCVALLCHGTHDDYSSILTLPVCWIFEV